MNIWRFPSWVAKNWYFFILDLLLNAFLITPLTIILWVSTWELIYNFVLVVASKHEHLMRAFTITLIVGSLTVFVTYLIQHFLRPCFNTTSSPAFIAIFIRGEMYFSFMARMVVWVSLYEIIGESVLASTLALLIGLIGLACLRSLNSGVSTPMNLQLDCQQQPCNQDTRYAINPKDNDGSPKQKCLYVLDALVTSLVIEYLIIAAWRGAFNILDIYMLPRAHPEISAWVTVIIGYNLLWIYAVLQFPASQISKQLSQSPWKQVSWELVCWLYAFIMMVCLWRGFWNLITIYSGLQTIREPYDFVLSLIMHIISVLITLGLNVFVNGRIPSFHVADGALNDGSGILIKNYMKNVSNMMATYISEDASETTTLLHSSSKDPTKGGSIQDQTSSNDGKGAVQLVEEKEQTEKSSIEPKEKTIEQTP